MMHFIPIQAIVELLQLVMLHSNIQMELIILQLDVGRSSLIQTVVIIPQLGIALAVAHQVMLIPS